MACQCYLLEYSCHCLQIVIREPCMTYVVIYVECVCVCVRVCMCVHVCVSVFRLVWRYVWKSEPLKIGLS